MKKELAMALPLALGAPLTAQATCGIANTGAGSAATTRCAPNTTTDGLSNISSGVTLQASAGVIIVAEDASGKSGSDFGAQEIVASACHEGGSAAYYGDTGGGGIQKNGNFGTGNCSNGTSDVGYTSASSGGTL